MGREIRRVPLDFAWPLNKPWEGFLNPHYKKCEPCDGASITTDRKWFEAVVYLLMMLGQDSSRGLHPWLVAVALRPDALPGKQCAELTRRLAGRAPFLFGHDAIDRWSAEKKILKAAGLPKSWGVCKACKGSGVDASVRTAYNRWRPKKPPKGPGYQVWETVSEGSPISPVFKTTDELVTWLTGQGYSRAAAEGFANVGSAPSMVTTSSGKLVQDIDSCAPEVS